jgi:hypothetical protein
VAMQCSKCRKARSTHMAFMLIGSLTCGVGQAASVGLRVMRLFVFLDV